MRQYVILVVLSSLLAINGIPTIAQEDEGRNLVQFGNMISQTLGVSALDYNGYGCWCGFGGKGQPVDPTDACCKAHDECYDEIINNRWSFVSCSPYLAYYSWDYDPISRLPYCKDTAGSCTRRVCECDRIVTECYKKNFASFNKSLKCPN